MENQKEKKKRKFVEFCPTFFRLVGQNSANLRRICHIKLIAQVFVQKSVHLKKMAPKLTHLQKKKAGRDSIKNLEDGRPMRRLWPSYSLWFGITMMGTKTCCNPSVKSCSTTFRVIHKLRRRGVYGGGMGVSVSVDSRTGCRVQGFVLLSTNQ